MFVPSLQARRRQTEWITASPPRSSACPASAMAAVVGVNLPSSKPQPRWYVGSSKRGESVETGTGAIMTYHWILRAGSPVWISCGSLGR
jgi:hypothetical protein